MYVGPMEDSGNGGLTTATMIHYGFSGPLLALAVNGAFSYLGSDGLGSDGLGSDGLGSDGLGSASVALDSTGNVQTSVLYGPYGTTRYSNGTMPGSYGYTGQHADATTGLDYYNFLYRLVMGQPVVS